MIRDTAEDEKDLKKTMDDLQALIDSGDINELFIVGLGPAGKWTLLTCGMIQNLAKAASYLQAKFTAIHINDLV